METKQVKIVELADNSRGSAVLEKCISMQQFERLLRDTGQTDCPLLEAVGYPIILVSTTPAKKCIPAKSALPVSGNPHNNWMGTTAASRIETGLAPGIVVGDVYALRKDGKDLTLIEWGEIWDVLQQMMDDYGEGPFVMTDKRLEQYKTHLQYAFPRDKEEEEVPQEPSNKCWYCQKEPTGRDMLWTCGQCKTAKYCSKQCQKDDWKRGHKRECHPAV